MLKVLVGYPSADGGVRDRRADDRQPPAAAGGAHHRRPDRLQQAADAVYADPALLEYAVRLVTATRDPAAVGLPDLARYITYGASPRASINLILTARALALIRGRDYVLPQDVRDMALDVMRHRLVLSFEALSDNVTSDELLVTILSRVPVPTVPLRERVRDRAHDRVGA